MNAWTTSLMPGLEKGFEVESERGCSWPIHRSLQRPGWVARDKDASGDWDLNLEKLGMPNSEACES